jgi:hypothetical protein
VIKDEIKTDLTHEVLESYFIHFNKKRRKTMTMNLFQKNSLFGLHEMITDEGVSKSSIQCATASGEVMFFSREFFLNIIYKLS